MAEPEEPQEQEFEILEALASIADVGDFRLGDFMRQHGMNPGQTAIFYRRLISEARENKSLIDILERYIDRSDKAITKFKADASAKDEQIKKLRAEKGSLQGGSQQRIDKAEAESRQLRDIASQSQEDANSHNLLKEFLQGRMHPKTVEGLYRLFYHTHMAQLTDIGRQPPSDPGRLDKIEERLRQEFRNILRIPQEELEKEMDKLRAKNAELQKNNTALALAYGALRQRGWVDTSRDETTEGGG